MASPVTALKSTCIAGVPKNSEWHDVVDAWQLDSWESYRDVRRLGRKKRSPKSQRAALWPVFEQVGLALETQRLVTRAGVFDALSVGR